MALLAQFHDSFCVICSKRKDVSVALLDLLNRQECDSEY
jgi:hypothetical protein